MKIYATSQAALSRFVGKDLWVFVSGGKYNQYESFLTLHTTKVVGFLLQPLLRP